MRAVREGEVPKDGGTALQEDADRPVFNGNGPDDYVCVECGNVLADGDGRRLHDQEGARPLRALPDGQRRRHRRVGRSTARSGAAEREQRVAVAQVGRGAVAVERPRSG